MYKPKVFIASKEPTSIYEALQQKHWETAMRDIILALQRNGTWSLYHQIEKQKAVSGIQDQGES